MTIPSDGPGYLLAIPTRIRHPHLLVLIHGLTSRPTTMLRHFAAMGQRHGIVLMAPNFAGKAWRGFQRLGAAGQADHAASALAATACDLARKLGLDDERIDLAGYSAGAQFAHRFAMTRPHQVRSVMVGAAGWYTEADLALPFPEGLGGAADVETLKAFLALPIHVAIGAADRQSDASLRRSPEIDARQGRNRLERGRFWVSQVAQAAEMLGIVPRIEVSEPPGTGHSLSEAVQVGRLDRLLAAHVLQPLVSPANRVEQVHVANS